ncbi:hypothetical protein IGB42_00309 [Andreprevotia sp. IGB-42]|uniref:carboxypeptidase-like regulatory domain-containing protein n=1 Tax=Andreprevotia sp. IGB-42 TaxID=2497473 RepID=UPI00135B9C4E|nr:carboxypeptidase-like regulatory domain-containing protein [Andreprevotia sp. IGB-42]KAF0815231.1 hypothetical protein IGB42_00309 [Andreprevotia sp. IGB-42]
MNNFKRSLLQATTVAMLAIAPVYAADSTASFTSGGVGDSEEVAIKSERANYNVHLLLTEKSGAYLSGVQITIKDRQGNAVVDAQSEGPYFYAQLPDGQYTLAAESEGKSQQRKLLVRGGRSPDLHLTF